jgi:hypothetical protein
VDPVFANAFCLRPPKVLGVQLVPVSPGHVIVLSHLRSPFVVPGREPADVDVATAVWVLSMPATRLIATPGRRLERRLGRLLRRVSRCDLVAERACLRQYFAEAHRAPECWEGGDAGRRLKAPWPWVFVWTLMELGHQDWRSAFDMPIQMAAAMLACCGDAHGTRDLVDDEDRRKIARLAEMKKEREAAAAAGAGHA